MGSISRRQIKPPSAVATEEEVLTTLETPDETEGEPGIDKPGVPDEDVAEDGDYAADEDRTDADLEEPEAEKPKPRRSRRKPVNKDEGEGEQSSILAAAEAVEAAAAQEKPKPRRRLPRKKPDSKPEAA